ncbi:MAG TPA: lipopolysaccharide biosynthesis protein [Bacteroidales bacterium]|nr:lipopolysaccharide biosynthesis protein [Bacteroidales bacterium]
MFWSFSDSMATQLVQFIVGLVLARLLSPEEFGLVGMITVFIAVAQSFVDSGFGQALIRKKEAGEVDYSTVFYFNLLSGVIFFLVLYLSAPAISRFYNEPQLKDIARTLGVLVLIYASSITQRTHLIRDVSFRQLMKVNLTAAVISGVVAIIMALNGFGVWSLVWRSITGSAVQSIILWSSGNWIPKPVFSRASFRGLFSFGSKLMVSGLIDTIYRNIYLLIIGKFFSAADLGYYTRADLFSRLASQNLTGTVQRVSYPVLSKVQDEDERLKRGYRKLITSTMFITFFITLGMAAIAEAMIFTLIGEKWLPSVELLQLLCLSAMLFPLQAMNINILNVKGRSGLVLKLELVKKLLAVPVIVVGILSGLRGLLIGMIIHSIVSYFLNSYYSGRLINYPAREQVSDIMPSFLVSAVISIIVFLLTLIISIPYWLMLVMQLALLTGLTVVAGRVFGLEGYKEIKDVITEKMPQLKRIL